MFQQTTDVVQRHVTETGIAIAGKERLVALPQALVRVHAGAVILKQGLGHERHGLAVFSRRVLDDVDQKFRVSF